MMFSPTAGRTRMASLRHAWKYGRDCACAQVRFPSGGMRPDSLAETISVVRAAWTVGSERTCQKKDCIVEAVESEPAKLGGVSVLRVEGWER